MRCRGVEKNGGQGSRVVVLGTMYFPIGCNWETKSRVLAIIFSAWTLSPKNDMVSNPAASNICRINSTSLPLRNIKLWGKFRAFFVVNIPVFSHRLQTSHGQVPCEACSETCWKLSKWRHGDMETWRHGHSNCRFLWMNVPSKEVFESTIPKRLQGWSIHQRFVVFVMFCSEKTEEKHTGSQPIYSDFSWWFQGFRGIL